MFKKWRSCLLSVLLVCFMFLGLSSNTLVVNAATEVSQPFNGSFEMYPNGAAGGSSGYISNGSGTISYTSTAYGQFHFCVPITYRQSLSNWSFSKSGTDLLNSYITYYAYWQLPTVSLGSSAYNGDVSNICLTDKNHTLLNLSMQDTAKGSEIFNATAQYTALAFYLEFDVGFTSYNAQNGVKITYSGTSLTCSFRDATSSEISAATIKVSDDAANQSLDTIESSTQAIETSVTSDTGGGLLATIKNFFGSFFQNIINSFISLFVPSTDYFSSWFNNLNTLLSEKLGMLYAPFDLLISTLNAIYSADTTEPGIVFPGFDWDGQTVIEPFTFYFSSLGEQFQTLREAVYFSTDVIFLFAFLYLMQKKIALVLTGSEVNG